MQTLESSIKFLQSASNQDLAKRNIIRDHVLAPMLADLVRQSGVMHYVQVVDINRVKLLRDVPNTGTFWNGVRRFFETIEEILIVRNDGYIWDVSYHYNEHFIVAQQIIQFYDDNLKEHFGNQDMVALKI